MGEILQWSDLSLVDCDYGSVVLTMLVNGVFGTAFTGTRAAGTNRKPRTRNIKSIRNKIYASARLGKTPSRPWGYLFKHPYLKRNTNKMEKERVYRASRQLSHVIKEA